MSKIGKQPIEIPKGVEVKLSDNYIFVKGGKGELSLLIPKNFNIEIKDTFIYVYPKKMLKETNMMWGTLRALISNLIKGVTEGYEKKLQIEGIGYKAFVEGNKIILNVGYTHPVEIEAPKNVTFKVEKNIITISGIDKQLVGQVAANIRKVKPPEPYKGKGIRYVGEKVRQKAGKKAVAATSA